MIRKNLIFLIILLVSCGQQVGKPGQLDDGMQTATLQEVHLDKRLIEAMSDSISNGNYPNIHSVLILRHNKLVYENYWPGKEVNTGKNDKDLIPNHRDSLHDIRSITNSVTAAAVLVALGQGKIKDLNQRVMDFFPEYAKYDTGLKKMLTISHLMNMSTGLEWNQDIAYTDPKNSEGAMNNSPDAVEFVLSQKIIDTPGRKFHYSGACTQVLAAIIKKATGLPVDKFTEQYLFDPLGIEKYAWGKIKDGNPRGASGLRMRSRDMVKFGLLFMNGGKWDNKQVIPEQLVAQTLTSQITTPYGDSLLPFVGYSNQFWLYTENIRGRKVNYLQSQGNGGQIICMDLKNELVLIVTAGNYNMNLESLRKNSFDIFIDFVYPAIIK